MSRRLEAVLAEIDRINALDPNELLVDGVAQPKELAHSRMVSDWVQRFDPEPSEEQLIGARAHHLRRWAMPRSDYPDGRAGYLRWRKDQGERHRDEVSGLMGEAGYDAPAVDRVTAIMAKRGLATDQAVQVHEDALCMVFLETQLDDLIVRLGPDKAASVVSRTMRKMSSEGLAAAQGVSYSDEGRETMSRALALFEGEV